MREQLYMDVSTLAESGSRKVGSLGHDIAKAYLIKRMSVSGLIPYAGTSFELPYQVGSDNYTNLAGVLHGSDRQLAPLMLVAHYDTCGDQPGADDNAAAIAIWFALLSLLKQIPRKRDILFLFPDAEEPPRFLTSHMGSTNFYKKQRLGDIHAGLVLDLVGHDVPKDGMEDLLFIFGAESHQAFSDILMDTNPPEDLRTIATLNRYVGDLSDHHILRISNRPYLFFTCGRWQHYHEETDIPEHLNYDKMERITRYLFLLIKQIIVIDFKPDGFSYDSLKMELELLNRAIGPYLRQHSVPLHSRDDIQQFVLNWVREYQL